MYSSEKDIYNLTVSINKALNVIEAPLKIKHVRAVIITTHQTKDGKSFWTIVSRQPLMENQFTAWKFCHLLHKILREGHESTLRHSRSHKKMILEMGKLWGHLQDGLGHCIQSYSKLIVTKLDFHAKYVFFPGSLLIGFREIEHFARKDINLYFQLCVELFDYIEDIIEVQSKVFSSISSYRMSSMTPQGQCRLAPLITLIQDSNPLYDLSVRILFKLHDELPNDELIGHRDRFCDILNKLKIFYDNVRPLQYFADLIQVPHLPDNIPNFTSKVDFSSYIPPVVVVPPEVDLVDDLVDTKNIQHSSLQMLEDDFSVKVLAYENALKKRDEIIQQLQIELCGQRGIVNSTHATYKQELQKLENEISLLNAKLVDERELSTNMRVSKDELELQLKATPTLLQKVSEEEGKAKTFQDKFNKLKNMYTQIRDEHIHLLRQHGETTKHLNKLKSYNSDLTTENECLKFRLENSQQLISKEKLLAHQNLDLEVKMKEVHGEYEILNKRFENLQQDHKHLQNIVKEFDECKSKLYASQKRIIECNDKESKQHAIQGSFITTLKEEINLKTNEIMAMRNLHTSEMKSKNMELQELQKDLNKKDIIIKENDVVKRITEENIAMEKKLQELVPRNSSYKSTINNLSKELQCLNLTVNNTEKKYQRLIHSIVRNVTSTLQCTVFDERNINESQYCENILKAFQELDLILEELCVSYKLYNTEKKDTEELTKNIILTGHHFSFIKYNCIMLSFNTTHICEGQEILIKLNSLSDNFLKLFEALDQSSALQVVELEISKIKSFLGILHLLVDNVLHSSHSSIDMEDIVEIELLEMDKAIEEATEKIVKMLSSSRFADSGIKLKVNEKILDACTYLMECIKVLIQKSRILQEDIVSRGRGSVSVREFYKKNSQWSEGLISASKSVAKGAKLLVEAADKAVSGQPKKSFEIIVASQEIAACTAQLVAASRVKAPEESKKLEDLKKASRNVCHATGAVVATVNDCNKTLDISQDLDFSKLTASQAKTFEMDMHVKVLELEQALQVQRLRLSEFRRRNYQNADD